MRFKIDLSFIWLGGSALLMYLGILNLSLHFSSIDPYPFGFASFAGWIAWMILRERRKK